jgi:hypothetical protein
MKACTKCKIVKELNEFGAEKRNRDKKTSRCLNCARECDRLRYLNPIRKAYINSKSVETFYKDHEKSLKDRREHYHNNKEQYRKNAIIWNKENLAKNNALKAKYRAAKRKATPKWLTTEYLKEIEQFYIDAHELSWLTLGHLQVDHIILLQGENVSGLHVPWNLQIIPSSYNNSKNNKIIDILDVIYG